MTRRKKSSGVPLRPEGAKPRALIYCRVSSERQRDEHTIESQLIELPAFVQHMGWDQVEILQDDGISASSMERPAFLDALDRAKKHEYEHLVVIRMDRVTRADDDQERAFILAHLREHGVKIATPEAGVIDLDNPDHRFLAGIKAQFAAYESAIIKQRFRSGKLRVAPKSERRMSARDPYGLCWTPSAEASKEGRYVVVEAEADVVRLMFELIAKSGLDQVAAELNNRGLRTRPALRWTRPRHGAKQRKAEPARWSGNAVRRILRSATYRGELRLFEASARLTKAVPAIVDADLWARAQEILKGRRHTERATKQAGSYLLRGMATCSCGRGLEVLRNAGNHAYYRCYSAGRWQQLGLDKPCACPYLRVDRADAAVWATIEGVIPDALLAAIPLTRETNTDHWVTEERAANAALKRLKGALRVTLDMQRAGHIEEAEVVTEVARNATARKDAERKLEQARSHIADAAARQNAKRDSETIVAELLAAMAGADSHEHRRRILLRVVGPEHGGSIVITPDGICIRAAFAVGEIVLPMVWDVAPAPSNIVQKHSA